MLSQNETLSESEPLHSNNKRDKIPHMKVSQWECIVLSRLQQ